MPDARPVVRARGLEKRYTMGDVEVAALRGVDFDLFAGEFVVLLGPSGSGKSTLLNILGGLDAASAGTLVHAGSDLSHPSEEEPPRSVGARRFGGHAPLNVTTTARS